MEDAEKIIDRYDKADQIYEFMKLVDETAKEVGITLEQATKFIYTLGIKISTETR